jgi:hypothetical protein
MEKCLFPAETEIREEVPFQNNEKAHDTIPSVPDAAENIPLP